MKLIRFGAPGAEKPGVILEDGRRIDVSGTVTDYDEAFFADAPAGIGRLRQWVANNAASARPVGADARLGSPVARPGKIICIGLNYRDHAAESGMTPPAEPVVFFKATTALCGPDDDLVIPRGGEKTDWEVELAVVIGRRASYIEPAAAMGHVAGFVLHNDYSERAFQLERGGQWVKGKSCDTFAPLGPWLATPDEVADVRSLRLWLKVNGDAKQDGNTANMIFDAPFLVSYLSRLMTLAPGDVISTGTPAGVGLGFKPPQFLKPGDVVTLGGEGLGEQRQLCRAWTP
jgi:2-keto-4-pentenoate hydratase/2-oxohepta-3-ene-1,7-dioic acid hydratase in catechol pathway